MNRTSARRIIRRALFVDRRTENRQVPDKFEQ